MKSRTQQSQFARREKTEFLAKNIPCTDNWWPRPPAYATELLGRHSSRRYALDRVTNVVVQNSLRHDTITLIYVTDWSRLHARRSCVLTSSVSWQTIACRTASAALAFLHCTDSTSRSCRPRQSTSTAACNNCISLISYQPQSTHLADVLCRCTYSHINSSATVYHINKDCIRVQRVQDISAHTAYVPVRAILLFSSVLCNTKNQQFCPLTVLVQPLYTEWRKKTGPSYLIANILKTP